MTSTTTYDIRAELQSQADNWGELGQPALMERFVLRNGNVWSGSPRPKGVRKQQDKMCFRNAARFVTAENFRVWADHNEHEPRYTYVEGYAVSGPVNLLVHHAWIIDQDDNIIDLTWKHPERAHYIGVPISENGLRRELNKNGVYGVFDIGRRLNHEFMFQRDPGLKDEVNAILDRGPSRRIREAQAMIEAQFSQQKVSA